MLPKMRLIRQNHEANPPVADVAAEMRSSLQGIGFDTAVFQGKNVGIAVGSRGISHLVEIVRTAVSIVREAGGMPEIFAAMGCHGEASAAGQSVSKMPAASKMASSFFFIDMSLPSEVPCKK